MEEKRKKLEAARERISAREQQLAEETKLRLSEGHMKRVRAAERERIEFEQALSRCVVAWSWRFNLLRVGWRVCSARAHPAEPPPATRGRKKLFGYKSKQ